MQARRGNRRDVTHGRAAARLAKPERWRTADVECTVV